MEPVDKQVESQPKAAPEQVKDQPKAAPEQVKDHPKAAPEQTNKQKNPKRVEQGRKLSEWNKQNKQRLSRSAQPATQPSTQPSTQPTTQVEATVTDETQKHNTKDYVLLAETKLIVGLVSVGLYYFANQNDDQPVKISFKKRARLEPAVATSPKDDVCDMYFFKNIYILHNMDPSKIVNNAYHSAVFSSLVITKSVLSKKNTKYETYRSRSNFHKRRCYVYSECLHRDDDQKSFNQSRNSTA